MALPKPLTIAFCTINATIVAVVAIAFAIVYRLCDLLVFSILPFASLFTGLGMVFYPVITFKKTGIEISDALLDDDVLATILRLTGALLCLFSSGTWAVKSSGCPVKKGMHNGLAAVVIGFQAYFLSTLDNASYFKVAVLAAAFGFVSVLNLSVPVVNKMVTKNREPPQTVYSKDYGGAGYGSW
ncbi:unnamed protein product [Heterosigma akashiwo]|mmetsp:Transcript_9178/g.14455  ORF Transcript_9178/g.14455 Transcript_9178/m.14455 type:complete len:184 (+) Transcript_9178:57-608(+)|eukprot:CAMPEP_0194588380 /NCGR_PEP_ID=MMETSP0292-20121207/19733_1 /TAXON_ID=39354 /ORGANISM="Heterosigma akashiwo, Strain CCMP2393" /LENGTH=183 /DNA_ID=CAMNT_0039444847 /DNA_START=36 /DNA_END=587 /DNA_ORIENTATION=+